MSSKEYDYEQIKSLSQNPDPKVVLIDVREPAEFQENTIPNSINVPYESQPSGFAMDSETFFNTFKTEKPSNNKELIFFCARGRRAVEACKIAREAGYGQASLYPGSMIDWISKDKRDESV